MHSQEIRKRFLNYFKEKGHAVIPSSSVVPHDDPTLLFTNAGMNQFKDVFLGKAKRDYVRAATSQKCIRVGGKHNDLENVGHTTRHLTFFEMLGNFSFGDYFKKEAISYAWDVATKVYGLDETKIWATIFRDDDEAFELWRAILPEKRIVRLGEKDNFWAMGDTGPCGPCSELLFDRGEKFGTARSPLEDSSGERFFEFWNLVFMQFNRASSGEMTPLPKQSIDTGAGLERVVSLKMGVETLFATDIFMALIDQIAEVAKRAYRATDQEFAPAYHVIADHIRSLSFAISDGAQPSNTDRGYVLRKILRRAVRYGKMLGLSEPFLAKILPRLIEVMGEDYPELLGAKKRIEEILTLEEESFLRTLTRGGLILNTVMESAKKRKEKMILGEEAFKLKDTYGLPLEEIELLAKDHHLSLDKLSFEALEKETKERSRSARSIQGEEAHQSIYNQMEPAEFVGYEESAITGSIVGLTKEGVSVSSLSLGDHGCVILDKTPFYAEKGGQVGDTGIIQAAGAEFVVKGCQTPYPGVIIHIGEVVKGSLSLQERVTAAIDQERRKKIENNHTATHLLHWALQQVLGSHIRQAGSLVESDRLRFDFNHHKPLDQKEIEAIEDLVNGAIRSNKTVDSYELSYDEVQKKSEIKQFFGDKYGAVVRVIDIGFSKELCGGTHAKTCGSIGYFRITKEGSIAAGVRRIEAVTGKEAEELSREEKKRVIAREEKLLSEMKLLQAEVKKGKKVAMKSLVQEFLSQTKEVGGISFLKVEAKVSEEDFSLFVEELLERVQKGVVAIGFAGSEKSQLIIKVLPDGVEKGIEAQALLQKALPIIEGSGGGSKVLARGGGKNLQALAEALACVEANLIKRN